MTLDTKLNLRKTIGFKVGTIAITGLMAIMSYLGVGCKAQEAKPYETKPNNSVTETTQQETVETKEEIDLLEQIATKYSQEFASKLETIKDKTYLDAIIDNNEVLTSMNFFFKTNQIDKLLELKPNFKSWNDLYGILNGRRDEIINQYIDESIEYSGKMEALILDLGGGMEQDSAFFKYVLDNKMNIPSKIISNKSDKELYGAFDIIYSEFTNYNEFIKPIINQILNGEDNIKLNQDKKTVLNDIERLIKNKSNKLDCLIITAFYDTVKKSLLIKTPLADSYISPEELGNVINNSYIPEKELFFITNFCYNKDFINDMGLKSEIKATFLSPGASKIYSTDLSTSLFVLSDEGITMEKLKYFGDDKNINVVGEERYFKIKYNGFTLFISGGPISNFEPSTISNEAIPDDKPFIPYNIDSK